MEITLPLNVMLASNWVKLEWLSHNVFNNVVLILIGSIKQLGRKSSTHL